MSRTKDGRTGNVRRDGDELVVECEFGSARVSIDDDRADENLAVEGMEWEEVPEDARWRLLLGQVCSTISAYRQDL